MATTAAVRSGDSTTRSPLLRASISTGYAGTGRDGDAIRGATPQTLLPSGPKRPPVGRADRTPMAVRAFGVFVPPRSGGDSMERRTSPRLTMRGNGDAQPRDTEADRAWYVTAGRV